MSFRWGAGGVRPPKPESGAKMHGLSSLHVVQAYMPPFGGEALGLNQHVASAAPLLHAWSPEALHGSGTHPKQWPFELFLKVLGNFHILLRFSPETAGFVKISILSLRTSRLQQKLCSWKSAFKQKRNLVRCPGHVLRAT